MDVDHFDTLGPEPSPFGAASLSLTDHGAVYGIVKFYGEERGRKVRYAQAFEVCEYGKQPSQEYLKQLFPMLGK